VCVPRKGDGGPGGLGGTVDVDGNWGDDWCRGVRHGTAPGKLARVGLDWTGVFARVASVPGVLARDSSMKVFVGNSVEGVFERASMMTGAVLDRVSVTGVFGRISVTAGVLGRESTIGPLAGEIVLPPRFCDSGREGNGEPGVTLGSERLPWGVL
jgi:hypothetical protein